MPICRSLTGRLHHNKVLLMDHLPRAKEEAEISSQTTSMSASVLQAPCGPGSGCLPPSVHRQRHCQRSSKRCRVQAAAEAALQTSEAPEIPIWLNVSRLLLLCMLA